MPSFAAYGCGRLKNQKTIAANEKHIFDPQQR
jgi:hypothetical protein